MQRALVQINVAEKDSEGRKALLQHMKMPRSHRFCLNVAREVEIGDMSRFSQEIIVMEVP